MNRITKLLKDPRLSFFTFAHRGWLNFLDDETFLKIAYRIKMGRKLNFPPSTYNEKLQWLKIHDRNPLYTKLVDKIEAKKIVSNIIGDEYIIPTLGTWEDAQDINFDDLPYQFVLKVNHNSGGLFICKDKSKLSAADIEIAREKLNRALKHNYYWEMREWPYKDVKPMILAEKYMENIETSELRDYKFFCFNGEPKLMFVASERQAENTETKFDFFDMEFNHLIIKNGHPMSVTPPAMPHNFELMKELSVKLSKNIPHVRADFYEVNNKVYFGELTFTHWSGMVPFDPEEWDYKIGSWIDLQKV